MSLAKAFPNVATALAAALPPLIGPRPGWTVKGYTTLPASLAGTIALRVTPIVIPTDRFTQRARVHIDVLAATYKDGYDVSVEVQGLLASRRRVGSLILDEVICDSGPVEAPWDNTDIRRFLSIYRIATRR